MPRSVGYLRASSRITVQERSELPSSTRTISRVRPTSAASICSINRGSDPSLLNTGTTTEISSGPDCDSIQRLYDARSILGASADDPRQPRSARKVPGSHSGCSRHGHAAVFWRGAPSQPPLLGHENTGRSLAILAAGLLRFLCSAAEGPASSGGPPQPVLRGRVRQSQKRLRPEPAGRAISLKRTLDLERGGIFVPGRSEKSALAEIERRTGGRPIHVGPDCPEVDFLPGATNPTRLRSSIFSVTFMDETTRSTPARRSRL